MKFAAQKNRLLLQLILVILFFVQGMLAAHACVSVEVSAVKALSMQNGSNTQPCHESIQSNSNECLMHCTQSDQVNQDQHHEVAHPIDLVVLRVVAMPFQTVEQKFVQAYAVLNTGPPLSIRFCSFRI